MGRDAAGGIDLFFRDTHRGARAPRGARTPSFQHHLPAHDAGSLCRRFRPRGRDCVDRGCVTGDHLPIRGLRYPGGLADPGDPDGVLAPYLRLHGVHYGITRVLLATSGSRPARLVRAAVPVCRTLLDLLGYEHDDIPATRECLLRTQQIFTCGCVSSSASRGAGRVRRRLEPPVLRSSNRPAIQSSPGRVTRAPATRPIQARVSRRGPRRQRSSRQAHRGRSRADKACAGRACAGTGRRRMTGAHVSHPYRTGHGRERLTSTDLRQGRWNPCACRRSVRLVHESPRVVLGVRPQSGDAAVTWLSTHNQRPFRCTNTSVVHSSASKRRPL